MELNSFAPGQVVIREGEEGDKFHLILSGTVEYLTSDIAGKELSLGGAGPGEYFGELSILTGQQRTVRVRATSEVSSLSLGRSAFRAFLLANPQAALDVLSVVGNRLSQTDSLLRNTSSQNVNEIADQNMGVGQKIADGFASTMGSWPFIIVQSLILVAWVALNSGLFGQRWDPYPFILLNLALSFQAAYAAPIIMMSQNRQSNIDRLSAEIDHNVNLRAETKTGVIISRLDDLEKSIQFLRSRQPN
jgi:CRP/FNR family transcriptional regulator, cyclic AMP receptor protein